MPADDTLAEKLAAIRERFSATNYAITTESPRVLSVLGASTSDVPRLLAAVEAVLEVARKLEPQAPSASALEEDRMWVRQQCAEMIREAITRALTGEESR